MIVCRGTIARSHSDSSLRVHTSGTDRRPAAMRPGRSASHSWALTTSASCGTSRATFGMSSQKRRASARLPAGSSEMPAPDRADLELIGRVGELAAGKEVVTGDRDAVAAPDQSGPELEHQPHAAAAARLSADVMVDERDVHLGESAVRIAAHRAFPRAGGTPTVQYPVAEWYPRSRPTVIRRWPIRRKTRRPTSSIPPTPGPSVIRGSLLRISGYGLGTLATVASSAVVIRHLGLIDTGHFTTVTALVTIVATISDLGLTGIAVREYASGPRSDGRRFLRNLLGIRITIALSGLALAVLFGLLVGYPDVMVIGTVIAGAGMVVLVVQDGCSIPLQVGLRFGWVAGLQLAVQVGVAIEAVLLALAGAGLLPVLRASTAGASCRRLW